MVVRSPLSSQLLAEAIEYEKRFEWKAAAQTYREISHFDVSEEELSQDLLLKLAECYERAAYQTHTTEEFRNLIEAARIVYKKWEIQPESIPNYTARALSLRLESVLSSEMFERQRLLDEAISIQRRVIEQQKQNVDNSRIRECNFHLLLIRDRICLDNGTVSAGLLREALNLAQQEISSARVGVGADVVAGVYSHYVHFASLAVDFLEQYRDRNLQAQIIREAAAASPKVGDKRTLAALLVAVAHALSLIEERSDIVQGHVSSALDAARTAKDNYLIGRALWVASYLAKWNLVAAASLEESQKYFDEVCSHFEETKRMLHHLSDASSRSFLVNSYAEVIEAHSYHARFIGNREQKKALLEEAVSVFREGAAAAGMVGGYSVPFFGHTGAHALRWLASIEDNQTRKEALLSEALAITEKISALSARVEPAFLWNIGQRKILQGTISYELANITSNPTKKKQLFEEAAEGFREGITKLVSDSLFQAVGKSVPIAEFRVRFADVLQSLFTITRDPHLLQEQLQVLEQAAEKYSSASWHARAAEALWRMASLLGVNGKHEVAASVFGKAAKEYRMEVEERLGGFYSEYASYMDAWSQIELAKSNHDSSSFSDASRFYRAALNHLRNAGVRACLGCYFRAWAVLEHANQLSLERRHAQARSTFAAARAAFLEAYERLRNAPMRLQAEVDKVDIERFQNHAKAYADYSSARASIERARTLDEHWKLKNSAKVYEIAAKRIEALPERFEDPEERREIQALAFMSSALAKLRHAQLAPDSELYQTASKLFLEAKETTSSLRLGQLMDGNAALSRAMEQTLRFLRGGDHSYYAAAKTALEAASSSFSQIGLQRYEAWVTAAERQLDAYMYAGTAERDVDPSLKAHSYRLAEDSLRTAKEHFQAAGDAASVYETVHQLQKIKEAKSIYAKGHESLILPPSIREVMSTPTPLAPDRPAGLDYFEGPNLQAKVEYPTEIELETEFTVRLDLVNVGRASALLLRTENILPPDFALTRSPEGCKAEGGTLIFAARKLDPGVAETYTLQAVPMQPGPFRLSPRIVYVDEKGEFTIKNVESTILAVRRSPVFELKNRCSFLVFDYLARSFLDDNQLAGLSPEISGWRNRAQIIKKARISKAAVYGKPSGRMGPALVELLGEGLIEVRKFTGERGRGGSIVMIRVDRENQPVLAYLGTKVRQRSARAGRLESVSPGTL